MADYVPPNLGQIYIMNSFGGSPGSVTFYSGSTFNIPLTNFTSGPNGLISSPILFPGQQQSTMCTSVVQGTCSGPGSKPGSAKSEPETKSTSKSITETTPEDPAPTLEEVLRIPDPAESLRSPPMQDRIVPPVPEPSTWAMLLLGFAGLGMMAYRRRKPAICAV